MLFKNYFILASTSQSRYKILKNNNLSFVRIKPNCDEGLLKKKLIRIKNSPQKISLELAREKAKSVAINNNKRIVVGADTTIDFEGALIDKSITTEKARKNLISMSNKKHNICSSASVFFNDKEVWHASEKTIVKIRKLTKSEIDNYLKESGKKILSSVGNYHIEKNGPNIIEYIRGDFFNVMGFPLFPFLFFLKQFKMKK